MNRTAPPTPTGGDRRKPPRGRPSLEGPGVEPAPDQPARAGDGQAADAVESPLQALYALATLRSGEADSEALLRAAAGLAAEGAGCEYAAFVAGGPANVTVYAATDVVPEGAGPLLRLDAGSPSARALTLRQPVVGVTEKGPCWVAVPVFAGGSVPGGALIAGPFPATHAVNLEFLRAIAAFVASDVARARLKLPADGAAASTRTDIGALLESLNDPVALFGVDGRVQRENAAYRALLHDAGLIEGPLFSAPDVILPRDRAGRQVKPADSVLARTLAGRSAQAERIFRMADGRDRYFSVVGNPLRSDDQSVVGAAIVLRDVSEQIARERALRLMEEVRRGLSLSGDVRHAARAVCRRAVSLLAWVDMAAVYARDGEDLVFLAQAGFPARAAALLASVLMGPLHRGALAVHENRATLFQTDRDQPVGEASRRVVAASGAATFINLPLAAGTQRFGLITIASREPHTPARDELALLEALAAQIGAELEGVRRREEAETERARLQAVLDQLPEGVLLFDAGARLVMSNSSAEEILGQKVDPNTPLVSLAVHYGFLRVDGRMYQSGEEPIARTFSTGRAVLGEEQLVRRADGRDLPIVSNVAPVRGATGQLAAVIMVFQDITSLREMDRQKDEFLSIAGHELRSPIAGIRGLAQLLQRRQDRMEPGAIADALGTITEQTEQMAGLVDELLDVSRIRTGRLSLAAEPVDVYALLVTAVDRARLQREGDIHLTSPTTLPAAGDARRLLQVFANLLDNAAKYSDPQSPIEVDVGLRDGDIRIAVRDHGIGVPGEALDRLFERFFRAENAALYAGGLGLGLYLCREIVERHGGRIEAASTLGQGSTFTVVLPLAGGTAGDE